MKQYQPNPAFAFFFSAIFGVIIVFMASILLAGCSLKLSKGVKASRNALHVVEPAVKRLPVDEWADELAVKREACKEMGIETKDEGLECLGDIYLKATIASEFRDLYDELADMLETAQKLAEQLEALEAKKK